MKGSHLGHDLNRHAALLHMPRWMDEYFEEKPPLGSCPWLSSDSAP